MESNYQNSTSFNSNNTTDSNPNLKLETKQIKKPPIYNDFHQKQSKKLLIKVKIHHRNEIEIEFNK